MCGIAGIYNIQRTVNLADLKSMTDIICHRGPDGEGQWINQERTVGLGHRRLSIIDLSEDGKQPMHYADNRYTITFNGEIYNYIEIREKLLQKGYKFRSKSDTEVLMALYDHKKENCLQDLDGMFSFAIWDNVEKKLFCARDRFGEKPLFYHYIPNEKFVFASEMKELWAYGIPKEANLTMFYRFLSQGYITNPNQLNETFYKNILKLEAAHYIVIDEKLNLTKKQYWDIDLQKKSSLSLQQATEKFAELLTNSVKLRLRADVPVGSSLSGGLDSSTVVCIIDALNHEQTISQKTFSARFHNFAKDEGKFMQYVIDKTKVEPHFVFPTAEMMIADFDKLCYHQEEPFGSASIFAQWAVMELAKKNNVTVLLDGQGADEILAGYHPYYGDFFRELQQNNLALYDRETKLFENRYHNAMHPITPSEKAWYATKQLIKKAILFDKWRPQSPASQKTPQKTSQNNHITFLHKDFEQAYRHSEITYQSFNNLNDSLYFSTMHYGLSDLLRYADRNSMAHSREVRLPFLSHELVEFMFSLPSSYKIHEAWTKYVLRKGFEKVLPPEITWRTDKIGYEPPQKSWLESDIMKEKMHQAKTKLVGEKIITDTGKDLENKQWTILAAAMYF